VLFLFGILYFLHLINVFVVDITSLKLSCVELIWSCCRQAQSYDAPS